MTRRFLCTAAALALAAAFPLAASAQGKDPVRGLQMFFIEPVKNGYAWGEIAIKATPLALIALGLSIGALFVRSLTILMVEQETLSDYRFLEHGAFWAILALAGIMLASVQIEVPETVTGLIGAVLIGASFWASVRHRKAEAD